VTTHQHTKNQYTNFIISVETFKAVICWLNIYEMLLLFINGLNFASIFVFVMVVGVNASDVVIDERSGISLSVSGWCCPFKVGNCFV